MEFDLFGWGGRAFSAAVLIPYFAWGIYTLRLRFRYHEELAPKTEALTLLAVGVFFCVEMALVRAYIGRQMPLYYTFAILGVVVSGVALYGPLVVSLVSLVLVDLVVPAERSKTHEPRYAPAEALERAADYEGALREYMVIARIFPRDPTALVRIGDMYTKLSQPAEAAQWFERALRYIDTPQKSLQVTNRVSEIYNRQLGRPLDAIRVMEAYLAKFPAAEYAESVRERMLRLKGQPEGDLNAVSTPEAVRPPL